MHHHELRSGNTGAPISPHTAHRALQALDPNRDTYDDDYPKNWPIYGQFAHHVKE